jgi:hypothetical protein
MKKTKTIVISEDTHQLIKIYCAQNKLKLSDWIEKQLLDLIEQKILIKKND